MTEYLTLNTIPELACFIVALICLFKQPDITWKFFIIYLFATCATELFGIYIKHHPVKGNINNTWIYNIYLLFTIAFTSMMFSTIIGRYISIKQIVITQVCVLLILYANEFIVNKTNLYLSITYNLMSAFFIFYCLFYYYQLVKDEKHVNLLYSSEFWWITGALFFYFGTEIWMLLYPWLLKQNHNNYKDLGIKYRLVFSTVNIVLYSLWSYSFICKRWLISVSAN